MDRLFSTGGYVDAFRVVNPNPDQFTWWSNRGQAWANNVGWRIDYQIATPGIEGMVRGMGHRMKAVVALSVLPVVLAQRWFRPYLEKLGAPRYYVSVFLFLMMMSLPIKMLARWLFNLKYIVAIPEFFFNI